MDGISVVGYAKTFTMLTKEMHEKENEHYNFFLLNARVIEFNKGMKAKRILKASKQGTTIKFEKIKSKEEYDKELIKLKKDALKVGLEIN